MLGGDLTSAIDPYSIGAMLIFSLIGIIYYHKGKNSGDIVMRVCGFVLFLYGYFIYQFIYLLIIGIILTLIPYLRRFFLIFVKTCSM